MKRYRWYLIVLLVCGMITSPARTQAADTPTILVWSRDVPTSLRSQYKLAWSLVGNEYDVRFLDAFAQPLSDACEYPQLTANELDGVDVLVVSDWDGTFLCGSSDAKVNLVTEEIALIEQFVTDGGSLMVLALPLGQSEQDNLPDLVARFGLRYTHTPITPDLEVPQDVQATLNTRIYRLRLSGVLYQVEGGTPFLTYQGYAVATRTTYRQGKIVFIGVNLPFSDNDSALAHPKQLLYPPAILEAENAAFFIDVMQTLAAPTQSSVQFEQYMWDARLQALRIAFSGGTTYNDQPLPRGQADPAYIRTLQYGLEHAVRCDAGPSCVPFEFEPGDAALLKDAQQQEDRAWDALEELQRRVDAPALNVAQAISIHDRAVAAMSEAMRMTALIRARPVVQEQPSFPLMAWGVGFMLVCSAGTYVWRRHRKNILRKATLSDEDGNTLDA